MKTVVSDALAKGELLQERIEVVSLDKLRKRTGDAAISGFL